MAAGQNETVEVLFEYITPATRLIISRVSCHGRISLAPRGIRAHQETDEGEAIKATHKARRIEAAARQHHVVSRGRRTLGVAKTIM